MEQTAIYNIISIIVYVIISLGLTVTVLYYFTSNRPLKIPTYATLALTYWIGFSSIFLITIDVATAFYEEPTPKGVYDFLFILWQVVYWSMQFLAWILIPFVQVYVEQGHFNILWNFLFANIENFVLYIVYFIVVGIAGAAILIYLMVKTQVEGESMQELFLKGIPALCLQASNLFGLLLLIGFMGYGIIALPRRLWNKASHSRRLLYLQFLASITTNHLEEVQDDFAIMKTQLNILDKQIPSAETATGKKEINLRKHLDMMMNRYETIPELKSIKEVTEAECKPIKNSYWGLVKINRRMIQGLRKITQKHFQLEEVSEEAFFLQDVVAAQKNKARNVIQTVIKPLPKRLNAHWIQRLRYIWWCYIHPFFFRIMAILTFFIGLLLLWCEICPTIAAIVGQPNLNLSVYSHFIRIFKFSRILTQFIGLLIILYMTVVIYYGLFELKVAKYYSLMKGHSDAPSLLYSTVFLTRLIPALLFNFVILLRVNANAHTEDVAFFAVMGSLTLDKLSIIGDIGRWFADYFPLLILLVSCLTIISFICLRFLSCITSSIFQYIFHPTKSKFAIEDGARIIRTARRHYLQDHNLTDIDMDDVLAGEAGDEISLASDGTSDSDSDGFMTRQERRNKKKKKKKSKSTRTEYIDGEEFTITTHHNINLSDDEDKGPSFKEKMDALYARHGRTRPSRNRI